MKTLFVAAALLVAATVATYAHYGSFHPCAWLEQDIARKDEMVIIVARAKIRANFLVDGVASPDASDCLFGWWDFKTR